ncbi:hypothetical protein BURK1_01278 [Burkholderiales bacterium]|nr:hypothetical protein BURK1_01278 [Burkholderiales bacterium]
MNRRIALLLPTRGRPASLRRIVDSIAATAAKPDELVIVVGVDDDDDATLDLSARFRPDVPVLWSVGPRELTLGRLWNRLAAADHGCDVLAMVSDDYVMETPGWDDQYRGAAAGMPMGYGTAWPHDTLHVPGFCTAPVITRRMMERMGFFVPPWFPYWFHDTWLEEMGAFVACRLPLAARIVAPDGRGATLNMRDLAFWAAFFESTRRLRMSLAERMIDEMYAERRPLQASLKFSMHGVAMFYARRNAPLADTRRAAMLERRHGAPDDPGPRYLEARREAEALLASLGRDAP